MGDMTLLILGGLVLLGGAWCFLAGPCKDMFNQQQSAGQPSSSTTGFDVATQHAGMTPDQLKLVGADPSLSNHPVPPIKAAHTLPLKLSTGSTAQLCKAGVITGAQCGTRSLAAFTREGMSLSFG